ncbi:hypothetical protein ACFVTE_14105 [Arthrobacter sp. NPDC058097]|uniref:hypothetical protein n=1 Tax=Arthrobacter sp. NPDC058097 TaxID=3346340 RepID=UPI0036D89E91
MSYEFHLICDQNPTLNLFEAASVQFENKFTLSAVEGSDNLVMSFNGEDLALLTTPRPVPVPEVTRIFGEQVANQLKQEAWVSEVSCPYDKDTAEAVRSFLMITVIGTQGLLIDPQANEVINADWGS